MTNGRWIRTGGAVVALAIVLVACTAAPDDYTGDRKADFVYVTTDGVWHQAGNPTPLFSSLPGDRAVPGDYTGSGRWQSAVVRGWDWMSPGLASPIHFEPAGIPTAVPDYPTWLVPYSNGGPRNGIVDVPADYDGDGRTEPAYWSLDDGSWWISGRAAPVHFGVVPTASGNLDWDVPVPADYDGDQKADIAVFRPSDASYHILPSTGGPESVVATGHVGAVMPVPADYDGDGKTDPAVATINGEAWYLPGAATPFATFPYDLSTTTVPAPVDVDGDGHADAAATREHGDGSPATLEAAGHGVVATADTSGHVYVTMPAPAILVNYVRLFFYDKCLHNPYFQAQNPDHCPPS